MSGVTPDVIVVQETSVMVRPKFALHSSSRLSPMLSRPDPALQARARPPEVPPPRLSA